MAVSVAVALVLFSVGLAMFRSSEPTLRGHDLMAVAIEADGLSKRYRLGQMQAAYGTLRESMPRAKRGSRARVQPRSGEEIWALRDVSFEVREGRSSA